jgi:hypothetical protein
LTSHRDTFKIATGVNANAIRRTIDQITVFGPHSHTMRITGGMFRIALSRDRQVSPYDLLVVVSVTAGQRCIQIGVGMF